MKQIILGISMLLIASIGYSQTSENKQSQPSKDQQELLDLSKAKWTWMSEKKVDTLKKLFDEQAMFVHMGGSWGKQRELDVIKSGMIWYKKAEVYTSSVNIFQNAAILLNEIDLVAVVGQNEVVNPFMVTEVYIKTAEGWKLGALTFSKLTRPVKISGGDNVPKN